MSIYKDSYEEHANDKDFVKVVRCKDCKYFHCDIDDGGDVWETCDYHMRFTEENGYCSRAEMKEKISCEECKHSKVERGGTTHWYVCKIINHVVAPFNEGFACPCNRAERKEDV